MTTQIIEIGPVQLVVALMFILIAQVASLIYRLGLVRDLLIGSIRTFAQLFLMGYVLTFIFTTEIAAFSLAVFLVMNLAASHIVRGRVKERGVPFMIPMFLSMIIGYFVVSVMVTGVIIGADPWWKPQYFIPLSGMIVGNSMNALAVSLERLFSDLRSKKDVIEMKLTLGADYREATGPIVADALKAGMIPSINAMMGVGIVFIPGMMTGQILSGTDPMIAIRYQIVVMLMLVASTTVTTVVVVLLARNRCFGKAQQLILKTGNRTKALE